MRTAQTRTAKSQDILRTWQPFKATIGVTAVHNEADYKKAIATLEVLLEEVGENEAHPLAEVLNYLSEHVRAYEAKIAHIPEAKPQEVLRFLMEEHGLKQADLKDCAPQSHISDILNNKRLISKTLAKRLAERFHVRADLFL